MRTHILKTEQEGKQEPPGFSFTKEEAERAVKEALRWFGLVKRPQIFLISHQDLVVKFGIRGLGEARIEAYIHFDPNQTEFDVYFTEYTTDIRHNAHHEIAHLYFSELSKLSDFLESLVEKYVDSLAMLAIRRRRKR
jgi:hypothetical protein